MRYPGMTLEGAVLSLLYIIFFYAICWVVVKKRYANAQIRLYFFQGLTLKFIGALSFAIIYQFYYAGGDTFRYFANSTTLVNFFFEKPGLYLSYLLENSLDKQQIAEMEGVVDMLGSENSYVTVRLSSIFGLLTGNYYLITTFIFAFLSYIGVWGLYRTSCRLFPQFYKLVAIPILFIPSFFFWGSSIMKDSVVVGFLGVLIYVSYRLLLLKEFRFVFLLLFLLSFYVLFNVKVYVILSFLPALFLWLIFDNASRIQNTKIRLLAKPVSFFVILFTIVIGVPIASSYSDRYNVEKALETAEITATYIHRVSVRSGGSAYDLGNIEYTPVGLLRTFPKAVNVTLFRPYLWEVRNPVMLLAALEGTVFLMITLFLLAKIGPWTLMRFIFKHPFLLASLVFSIVFAFAVGLSTFNFGSLVRYKIPCLPFYGLVLAVVFGEYQKSLKGAVRIGSSIKVPHVKDNPRL